MPNYAIGIDLGGTKILTGLVDKETGMLNILQNTKHGPKTGQIM